MSKLSDVVKNDVVKKAVYDKLVPKVNNIDTSDFVLKTKYQADKTGLEKKIPDVSNLVKKAKLTELENKIQDISSLATKTLLTAVENKIPSVSNLAKKQFLTQKLVSLKRILLIIITTPGFNILAADVFSARLAQVNLVTKTNFDAKLSSLNRKITSNKSKNVLVENQFKNLKTFDSSYFIDQSHFGEDGTQNYLVLQPLNRYFKVIANTDYVSSLKSKRLSAETIKPPTRSDNSLTPALSYHGTKTIVKVTGSSLKRSTISYTHGKVVNIYIVNEPGASGFYVNDPMLRNSFFGTVTLTKNVHINKCGYSGYGIAFDRGSSFTFPGGGLGQNVIIFGADMSSFVHVDNKKKDILILGSVSTQELEHTLFAEKCIQLILL